MNCDTITSKQLKLRGDILSFLTRAPGLACVESSDLSTSIVQRADGKRISMKTIDFDDVLFRSDTEGKEFLQINFSSGLKILLTENLVGFKPIAPNGLDSTRIPKVVTTPDILSVFEAIQDSLHAATHVADKQDFTILRKVYEAVLSGGEAVGFDLTQERSWITRIPQSSTQANA